jgi:hypothetical protein
MKWQLSDYRDVGVQNLALIFCDPHDVKSVVASLKRTG